MGRRARAAAGWVAVLGALALGQQWVAGRRPETPDLRASTQIEVTSLEDAGPGSLREAIFAAAATPERVRIRLPAGRLVLETPLPPVVNAAGVRIEGQAGASEIDASGLSHGPVLEIDAPGSQVVGLTFSYAPEQAILVRGSGVRVVDSTFDGCDQGIYLVDDVDRLAVEGGVFTANRIGVRIGTGRSRADIRDSRFSRHTQAAVWSVGPETQFLTPTERLAVVGNQFYADQVSLVLANTAVRVEGNDFVEAREAAIVLFGEGAVIRDNRIRDGDGIGVIVDAARGTVIDGNEIDHNEAIGILVRASGAALVHRNRLYANGYGIAFVFGRPDTPSTGLDNTVLNQTYDGVIVIGDSPILRENRLLNSRLAGLRVLDFYASDGARTRAEPLLERNVVAGNTLDATVHGDYRAATDEERHE